MRVSFLIEQVSPSNREIVNKSLQIQGDTLRTANREKVALLIRQKKKQLEGCNALEWLERQVVASFQ